MERITKFMFGRYRTKPGYELDTLQGVNAVVDRLAAYEDIGPIDHLRELVQAEQDGKLVVLPCKVGDTVYLVTNGEIKKTEVESIHQWTSGHWKLGAHTDKKYTYWTGYEIDFEGVGKTVFLTREEAEAALEAQQGGNA